MGTWGPAIFSDDLACNVRDDFRDALAEGKSVGEAVAELERQYATTLKDADTADVFWFAIAATAWKVGRLEPDLKERALQIISRGSDLGRWQDTGLLAKRS